MPRYHARGAAWIGSYAQLRRDAARWLAPHPAVARVLARLAVRRGSLRERRFHAQSGHELCEIRTHFGKRLAEQTREQPYDRRIFPRRRGLRNPSALDLPVGGAHPDDGHPNCREDVVIREITNRPAERGLVALDTGGALRQSRQTRHAHPLAE